MIKGKLKKMGKGKRRVHIQYCERPSIMWWYKPLLHICLDCRFTAKRNMEKCPRCGSTNCTHCGLTARPPKKNASKKKWDQFFSLIPFSHPKGCR